MTDIVLVHGAFAGGFVWQQTADELRLHGHRVWTPTLTGVGERRHLFSPDVGVDTHVEDIEAVLRYEQLSDVAIVGHSYGGMVLAGLGSDACARIAHVVLLDAAYPRDGESIRGLFTQGDLSTLPGPLRELHERDDADIRSELFMTVPTHLQGDSRFVAQPMSTHYGAVRRGQCFDPPRRRTYIKCVGRDRAGGINGLSAARAQADGFAMHSLATPHDAFAEPRDRALLVSLLRELL